MVEIELKLNAFIAQDEAEELFAEADFVAVSGDTVFLRGQAELVEHCIDVANCEGFL